MNVPGVVTTLGAPVTDAHGNDAEIIWEKDVLVEPVTVDVI
jgi:hypothetical protein